MPSPLVEATSGALGSLLTCVLLYPVDLCKTRIQSGEALVKMLVALGNQSRVLVVRRADKQIFAQFDSDFLR